MRTSATENNATQQMIEEARHRLEILSADTASIEQRENKRLTAQDRLAVLVLLSELHRLRVAVSEQRKTLQSIADRKNRGHRKPAAARSQPPTTHNTRQKASRHRP